MLESGIGYELGGDAHIDYAATGLVYRVSVPLDGAVKDGSG